MRVRRIVLYLVLIMLAVMWLIPIYTLALTALKSNAEIALRPFWAPPENVAVVQNVHDAWTTGNLGEYFVNSLLYAGIGSVAAVFIASLAGFSLARLKFPGNNLFFYVYMLGTFFPFQMYLVPLVKLSAELNLLDTKVGLTLVYIAIAIPFAVFVMRNYFVTIPYDLQDAAKMDGLSNFAMYRRIFLPLAAPALAVAMIFQFVWIWNDLLFGLVLTTSTAARPVTTGLAALAGYYTLQWGTLSAGALVASFPTILLYMSLQKYFVRGILSGAVKA